MKKSFFILTLSVLSIASVLANTDPAHAAPSSSDSGYAKVTPLVEGLSAADVSIETWTTENPTAVGLTPNKPTYLATTNTSPQYTFKATVTFESKTIECWDLYTFYPNKTFTVTLFMTNNNTACELRGQQTD